MAYFLMAFDDIDRTGSGVISLDDVNEYMRKENCSQKFRSNFFNLFDANKDGLITFDEYCQSLGLSAEMKRKITTRRQSMFMENNVVEGLSGFRNIEIFCSDMIDADQIVVIEICKDVMTEDKDQGDMAMEIKVRLDEEFGPHWHVIVGQGKYGSNISNEDKWLLHFKLGQYAFLMWRTPRI